MRQNLSRMFRRDRQGHPELFGRVSFTKRFSREKSTLALFVLMTWRSLVFDVFVAERG